jgi:hypothetical protein
MERKGSGDSPKQILQADMDGLLCVSEFSKENVELFNEIERKGHSVGIGHTNFDYKSPFLRVGADEIVGAEAIRAYYLNHPKG